MGNFAVGSSLRGFEEIHPKKVKCLSELCNRWSLSYETFEGLVKNIKGFVSLKSYEPTTDFSKWYTLSRFKSEKGRLAVLFPFMCDEDYPVEVFKKGDVDNTYIADVMTGIIRGFKDLEKELHTSV